MRNIYIGIIVILILAIGAFVFLQNNNASKKGSSSSTSTTSTTNNSSSSNQSSSNQSSQTASDSVTITYSDSGFSPAKVTVKSGGSVTIKNTASDAVQFNSDPHPVHTDNPELNVGVINSGDSKTITVTKTGTWGYHNHLNPDEIGTIVVQ